jgi:predicted GNAT family acetyltransferase
MKLDLAQLKIDHNPQESRFEVFIEGQLCKLDYFVDRGAMVIAHVGVHPDFRGQGVAGRIVQTCLDHARENGLRVIPMCSYAAAYIRQHPQYQDLLRPTAGG